MHKTCMLRKKMVAYHDKTKLCGPAGLHFVCERYHHGVLCKKSRVNLMRVNPMLPNRAAEWAESKLICTYQPISVIGFNFVCERGVSDLAVLYMLVGFC